MVKLVNTNCESVSVLAKIIYDWKSSKYYSTQNKKYFWGMDERSLFRS